ncbi:MAG: hypothetical protein ACODAJ_01330 [Planctomycetota bacterium]
MSLRLTTTLLLLTVAATAPAAPAVADGLVLWLDAADLDGDGVADEGGRPVAVRAWADRTASGLRAEQPDDLAPPRRVPGALGGRPAVRFDGDDFLNLGQPAALDLREREPFTVVVVAEVATDAIATFLARGGGADRHRSVHLYMASGRVGAITYGARSEARRGPGPYVLAHVCDGRRGKVFLNGEAVLAHRVGQGTSAADVLIGARRETAENTGTHWPLTGAIAELRVYDRALSDAELRRLGQALGEKYGIAVAASPTQAVGTLLDEGRALDAAERLLRSAQANRLSEELAEVAAGLLGHNDPFVRGIAEWALAMKVGGENNGQEARWPSADPPKWLHKWLAFPVARRVQADWVRQAVSRGIHRHGKKLLADADALVARARRMAADLDLAPRLLRPLQAARIALAARLKTHPADLAGQQQCWLDARKAMRRIVMAHPAIDFDQVLFVTQFAPHTVRNITRSYQWKHKPGGDLCVLDVRSGEARSVLGERLGPGFIWGLDLWWNADRAVFGYAKQPVWPPAVNTAHYLTEGRNVFALRASGDHPPLHLYEVELDGSGLRQLTDHPYWNDFEPTWCADGSVVFASDRCGRSAECGNDTYDHMNPNLCLRSPDGRVRQLTDNKDIDRYPHSLADGRIAYTHWEYQERHFMEVHAIWTVRPDGTMADALFKHHMGAPCGLRDVRSVPGTARLAAIATGHHTFAWGPLVLVDPQRGMNAPEGIAIVTPGVRVQEGRMAGRPVPGGGVPDAGGLYQTPFALSDTCFLVSYAYARPKCTAPGGADSSGFGLYLIDIYGNRELLHRDPLLSCTFPIPVRKRPRPPLVPRGVGAEIEDDEDEGKAPAVCYVTDVYDGVQGVERGTIKFIRVAQHVGWPLDPERGAMHYIPGNAGSRHLGFQSWSPVRVLGEVAVEADGSAHFTVPADTALYFQALDERHMEVLRMRSMVSLAPGERRGCRGCHQSQAGAPAQTPRAPLALRRPPSAPEAPPWGREKLLGYEWLVQPILDEHCVRCHGAEKPDGGIDLSATRAADGLVQSYRTLLGLQPGQKKPGRRLVAVANRFSNVDVTRPRQFGSRRSPFITVLLSDPLHKKEVHLKEDDWYALVTWVDANAPYYDAFVNKRPAAGGPPQRTVPARPLPTVADR